MTILANRLKKNLKKYKSLLKTYETNAFRLYHKDIPEIPYYIDIYDKIAVVYEKGIKNVDPQKRDRQQGDIKEALNITLGISPESIFFKTRQKQQGANQYQANSERETAEFYAQEGEASFIVKPEKYLDTGLFLDHRKLRSKFYQQSEDKRVLNLFCYTGSFSIQALLGGAREAVNIDLSNTYLNWFVDNAYHNQIPHYKYQNIKASALEWLKTAQSYHQSFDSIILDPPSFSNSKSMSGSFDIQRDHEFLVRQTMKFLKPDGVLYFSNNKEKFELSPQLSQEFKVADITNQTTSIDFARSPLHKCYQIINNTN